MSGSRIQRRNERYLPMVRAAGFGLVAWSGLTATHFYPAPLLPLAALLAAALGYAAPAGAALLLVTAIALPMAASDLATGIAVGLVGLASLQYLRQSRGAPLLAVGLALVGSAFGAEWAVPVAAGYLLGAGEGAVAAAAACVVLELSGVLLGAPRLGVVVASGGKAALDFAPVADALSFGWIADALEHASPDALIGAFASVDSWAPLLVQPVLWAAAGWVAGKLRRKAGDPKRLAVGIAATAAATLALAAASAVVSAVLGTPLPPSSVAVAAGVSLVAALAVAIASDTVFLPEVVTEPKRANTAEEDADVDELLRLIAEAEDELASKHTSDMVVMITDMKSFSAMTEEDGSVVSAKMIQRHRDLLLPLIEGYRGHGKSTGGDGLVAAFPDGASAIAAAVEMQRALRDFNRSRPGERPIAVRIGIARGEVVLDRSGRPFIGAGLNKAARIMNLADGGQVFVSKDVADKCDAAGMPHVSRGTFPLKNIAEPVEVVEIAWGEPVREAS